MTCIATPQHKYPCPRSDEIYNFDKPFIGHYYFTFSLSEPYPGVKKTFLKKYTNFTLFSTNYLLLSLEWGS